MDVEGLVTRRQAHRLLRVINDVQQTNISGGNHAGVDHGGSDPVDQTRPIGSAHEHEREGTNLPGLDQGRGFEELISLLSTSFKYLHYVNLDI